MTVHKATVLPFRAAALLKPEPVAGVRRTPAAEQDGAGENVIVLTRFAGSRRNRPRFTFEPPPEGEAA